MSVALRIALDRDPDVALGTIATAGTALVIALVAAAAETPSRGLHLSSAWPFLLAGLLSPGAAQILVTLAIRESGASRVSMVFGTAPLVSVTIALIFLSEPARAPLIAGAVLVAAGGVELARERQRPAHLNRLGLVYAFAGATLFAIRDNLVRHLAVGQNAVPPAVAASAALFSGTVLVAIWARERVAPPVGSVPARGRALRPLLRLAVRGVLPRPGHGRGAARRDRVARRGRAFRASPARIGARGEEAPPRRRPHRGRRRAHRRDALSATKTTARAMSAPTTPMCPPKIPATATTGTAIAIASLLTTSGSLRPPARHALLYAAIDLPVDAVEEARIKCSSCLARARAQVPQLLTSLHLRHICYKQT